MTEKIKRKLELEKKYNKILELKKKCYDERELIEKRLKILVVGKP